MSVSVSVWTSHILPGSFQHAGGEISDAGSQTTVRTVVQQYQKLKQKKTKKTECILVPIYGHSSYMNNNQHDSTPCQILQ